MRDRDVGASRRRRRRRRCAWPCTSAITGAGQVSIGVEQALERVRLGDVLLVREVGRAAHPLDVGAGAEARPLAGEHDRPRLCRRRRTPRRARRSSSPSKAFRVSGRANVTRRRSPSRSIRSASIVGVSLESRRWAQTRSRAGAARNARRERDAAPRRGRASSTRTRSARCSTTTSRRGLDGILAFGTNGEGILFSVEERRRGLRLFVEAAAGQARRRCPLRRADDRRHRRARRRRGRGRRGRGRRDRAAVLPARRRGAAGAFRAPPRARARRSRSTSTSSPARAGTPSRSTCSGGCARRRRTSSASRSATRPWEAFEPYLGLGLDVFVGPEALIHRGIEGGAIGAVSALASPFPAEVAAVVREPTADGGRRARRACGQPSSGSPGTPR